MAGKWLKNLIVGAVVLLVVGAFVFGGDMVSYLRSSSRSVQQAVKDAVPVEFELGRARDLLEDIIPEMHANIRLIAQEEVEVAALTGDIEQSSKRLALAEGQIKSLRDKLAVGNDSYTLGGRNFSHAELKDELARRFDQFTEAQVVLAGKERLLQARQKSLAAARKLLERTRSQKEVLASKIETLESQYRLVQASSVGTAITIDNSKIAQTEKLISQIKKRLDVAERVLAHESRFVETIEMDTITDQDLLNRIDDYFQQPVAKNESAQTP